MYGLEISRLNSLDLTLIYGFILKNFAKIPVIHKISPQRCKFYKRKTTMAENY